MGKEEDLTQFYGQKAFVPETPAEPQTTPEAGTPPATPAEPVAQPEGTPPIQVTPAETPQAVDYISSLNTKFQTSFKSDEDLKAVIANAAKTQTLENQLKDFETLKSDIEYYKKGVNPLDYFSSEDSYRMEQFRKANPDKDAGVAGKLFTADLEKVSDLDVLAQYELLHGTFQDGEVGAKELVASTYEIDLNDPESWTRLSKNTMARAANKARQEIKEMKSGIKLPDTINLASQREAEQKAAIEKADLLKKGWGDVVPKMMTDLKEVAISDLDKDGKEEPLLKYTIDDEAKKALGDEVMEFLVASGKEINEDNVKEAAIGVQREYILRNLPKIIKAYHATQLAEYDAKKDKETHNAEIIKTDKKDVTDAAQKEKQLIEYATGGHQWTGNKLF